MVDKIQLNAGGRIWLESEKGPILGYGRLELLEKIIDYGSITKAANEMKMSYSQAWELIESMNINAGIPLVVKQTGGKGGGGAAVTPYGETLIKSFKDLNQNFQKFLKQQLNVVNT